MSFANNGVRVKYVKNLKRAPTDDFGPSGGAIAPPDHMEAPPLTRGRPRTKIYCDDISC